MRSLRLPFMDPLVRAIADGAKTETRRLLRLPRLPKDDAYPPDWAERAWSPDAPDDPEVVVPVAHDGRPNLLSVYPRGRPGDEMAVCEALIPIETMALGGSWYAISYRADRAPVVRDSSMVEWDWRVRPLSPRYCPDWAIRHRRTLTSVRPERLSQITDAGAVAEGIRYLGWPETRQGFLDGFRKMHGLAAYADPWVVVYSWANQPKENGDV